jgi:hypothetical protein
MQTITPFVLITVRARHSRAERFASSQREPLCAFVPASQPMVPDRGNIGDACGRVSANRRNARRMEPRRATEWRFPACAHALQSESRRAPTPPPSRQTKAAAFAGIEIA